MDKCKPITGLKRWAWTYITENRWIYIPCSNENVKHANMDHYVWIWTHSRLKNTSTDYRSHQSYENHEKQPLPKKSKDLWKEVEITTKEKKFSDVEISMTATYEENICMDIYVNIGIMKQIKHGLVWSRKKFNPSNELIS